VRTNIPPTLKGLYQHPDRSILTAMPQSLARILVHTVFSTKDRRPWLRYVAEQEQHHRKVSFQDEFRLLLKRYELACDERYVRD
jgi:hypothetical protein